MRDSRDRARCDPGKIPQPRPDRGRLSRCDARSRQRIAFPDCRSCCERPPFRRAYRDRSLRQITKVDRSNAGVARALATEVAPDDSVVIGCIQTIGEEAILRTLSAFLILAVAMASAAPALAADPFPVSGAAKLAAYSVCHCAGIVKTGDGSKLLDNLAIRCIEEAKARHEGYAFSGTCIQTDGDGDKIFMTYEGPETGTIEWIGGTGKYQDILGKGIWSVVDAPGNSAQLFAFTFNYDVNWTSKTK